jgi:hypothetical protein
LFAASFDTAGVATCDRELLSRAMIVLAVGDDVAPCAPLPESCDSISSHRSSSCVPNGAEITFAPTGCTIPDGAADPCRYRFARFDVTKLVPVNVPSNRMISLRAAVVASSGGSTTSNAGDAGPPDVDSTAAVNAVAFISAVNSVENRLDAFVLAIYSTF